MLSSMLKEHQKRNQDRRDQVERKKTEALDAASQLGACLADSLNEDIARAYSNQRKIDAEIRLLQTNVDQFSKQTNQWLHLMDTLNNSVKELGDVENWSKSIQNDLKLVSTALEYAYKVGKSEQN